MEPETKKECKDEYDEKDIHIFRGRGRGCGWRGDGAIPDVFDAGDPVWPKDFGVIKY